VAVNVFDVMKRRVISVSAETSIDDAIELMLKRRISGLPVVDHEGGLVGIVTEKDFLYRPEIGTERRRSLWLDALLGPTEPAHAYVRSHGVKVKDVMTPAPLAVKPGTPLAEVVSSMESQNIKRLPVVDHGRLVGIVSRADLLRAVLRAHRKPASQPSRDLDIRSSILNAIGKQSWSAGAIVDVVVNKGVADLWGSIADLTQRRALRTLVESTPGIKSVRDHLVWKGQPLDGESSSTT
jgi:CBS domain-containing protein